MRDLNIMYDEQAKKFCLTYFDDLKDEFEMDWKPDLAAVLRFAGDYFTPGATKEGEE